jgi:HD-GYP domain-containing protein (c-di-GMP phosphodiesterase class II)
MSDRPDTTASGSHDQALALALAVAIRTGSYYESDNAVMRQACSLLASLLAEQSASEGSVTIGVHSHCVFVGRARVRATVSTYGRFADLIQLFESWNISTLTLSDELTEEELMQVVLILAREHHAESASLAEIFASRGLDCVQVDTMAGGGKPQAIAQVEAYAAAMELSDEMRENAEDEKSTNVRRLRRVTQAVVDQILRDPQSLVALTTIKDFDRFLICHSIDVAVLAVVLGQRLGMSKSKLGELCLAAFLHDAGKLGLPRALLDKPGVLDPEEWEEMRRHPILAARSLLGTRRLTTAGMKSVVVAFEHHLNYDMSGYPPTEIKDGVTLFGNIVGICDRYDALTSPRVYRPRNFTPHEALVHVIDGAKRRLFDPVLVKLFVEIMGLYPPGTLLELTSGELAVACAAPAIGRPLDRPKVRVVTGGERGSTIDLDESTGGNFLRSVKTVVNPANKGQVPAVDPALLEEFD